VTTEYTGISKCISRRIHIICQLLVPVINSAHTSGVITLVILYHTVSALVLQVFKERTLELMLMRRLMRM